MDVALPAERLHDCSQCGRRATGPADDSAEVVGIDPDFERVPAVRESRVAPTLRSGADADVVR